MRFIIALLIILLPGISIAQNLRNPKATKKTRNLYNYLYSLDSGQVLFGHQDDLAYGVDWWGTRGNSDVKLATGKYPAIFGWDIGKLGNEHNIDSVDFDFMVDNIKMAYRMGGINTISWHMDNPHNHGNSWDKSAAIKHILPGGPSHEHYLIKLDQFASFIKSCKVGITPIPIIIRPFHEHNGDWFWWGKGNNSEEDYIELWHFTVDYLESEHHINNLIYAFSPDRSRMDLSKGKQDYFWGYPGDKYVDIIGLDNYWDLGHNHNQLNDSTQRAHLNLSLELISGIAANKGKVAALTETGNEGVKPSDWFTYRLLEPMEDHDIRIAWVLVWRNANSDHFYVPLKGHHNYSNFMEFEAAHHTVFLSDHRSPYKKQ